LTFEKTKYLFDFFKIWNGILNDFQRLFPEDSTFSHYVFENLGQIKTDPFH